MAGSRYGVEATTIGRHICIKNGTIRGWDVGGIGLSFTRFASISNVGFIDNVSYGLFGGSG